MTTPSLLMMLQESHAETGGRSQPCAPLQHKAGEDAGMQWANGFLFLLLRHRIKILTMHGVGHGETGVLAPALDKTDKG